MCGFGVILHVDHGGLAIPDAWLDLIDAASARRGPDGSGRYRNTIPATGSQPAVSVAMTHRRLAVIDPGHGHQPLVDGAGDAEVAVVFNGFIANHRELRRDLESAGAVFQTDHCDTEVLVHGHRHFGAELPQHLNGMYAYAIWDHAAGTLTCNRDWFGEKPLSMGTATRGEARIAVVATHALVAARILRAWQQLEPETPTTFGDEDASGGAESNDDRIAWTAQYLALGYSGLRSPYPGVNAIPPSLPPAGGDDIGIGAHRPWRVDSDGDAFRATVDDALTTAVRLRVDSDVPLGCFLSGGIDSALIAQRAFAACGRLDTFTVRMPDDAYDESEDAAATAKAIGTTHHCLSVTETSGGATAADDLQTLVRELGLPFGDSSLLPTYWVSRAASAHVTVALSGDGGDELAFGYDRYRAAGTLATFGPLLRLIPWRLGAAAHPKSRRHRLARAGTMARDIPRRGLAAISHLFTHRQLADLLSIAPGEIDAALPPLRVPANGSPMSTLRAWDLTRYLPHDLLVKSDLASMTCGLEVRAPFLDRGVVDLFRHAEPLLITRGGPKGVLKELARPILGDRINSPKRGFAIPIDAWFRGDFGGLGQLIGDTLNRPNAFGTLPIRQPAAAALLDQHLSGDANHGQRLFALLTLGLWARDVLPSLTSA